MQTTRRFGSHTVEISRPDKIFFPQAKISKGELIDYYERIADTMLPYVKRRIVTMHRFPNGVKGKSFYQKDVPDYFPHWISTVTVEKENGSLTQLMIQDSATLVYLASQACITPHIWLSRADRRHHPDRMIFDLDPSDENFTTVRAAARALHKLLEQLCLVSFVMTTGSRGLHVVVPLDRKAEFDVVRKFAGQVADIIVAHDPRRFTTEVRKNKRRGRVFIDTLRNAYAQHAVAPYAVRAKPEAPVAMPLDWHELNADLHPRKYTIRNAFRRLTQKRDPWRAMTQHACSLTKPQQRLAALVQEYEEQSPNVS